MGNPFFNTKYNPDNPEHKLYNNAANEIVQQRGIDMYFIPREIVKEDHIFGEDVLSEFNEYHEICFYIENFTGWEGTGDIFSKFGFQVEDTLIIVCQQENFKSIVYGDPKIKKEPNKNDLIYHEASKRLFEVIHCEGDDSFYQFSGENMMFKLTCKLFKPSSENFETGIDEIDKLSNMTTNSSDDEENQFEKEKKINIDFDINDIFGNV